MACGVTLAIRDRERLRCYVAVGEEVVVMIEGFLQRCEAHAASWAR